MDQQRQRQTLRLTPQLRLVLASVVTAGRPVYCYEVAKSLEGDLRTVMGNLHRLETAGYARVVAPPGDAPPQGPGRDRVWFELTDEGREFAEHVQESTARIAQRAARAAGLQISSLSL
jgi:DNA-binding PadR family transcriptional regulator